MPNLAQLRSMSARFAPVTLKYDEAGLSAGDRQALPKLMDAARVMNTIFMDQIWSGNRALYEKLQQDNTAPGKERLRYFLLNKGPWSDLDGHTAFIGGVPERTPPGGEFYPKDMTSQEFETWVKVLPAPMRQQAMGFFTVIRRRGGAPPSVPSPTPWAARPSTPDARERMAKITPAPPPRARTSRKSSRGGPGGESATIGPRGRSDRQ